MITRGILLQAVDGSALDGSKTPNPTLTIYHTMGDGTELKFRFNKDNDYTLELPTVLKYKDRFNPNKEVIEDKDFAASILEEYSYDKFLKGQSKGGSVFLKYIKSIEVDEVINPKLQEVVARQKNIPEYPEKEQNNEKNV